MPRKSTRKFIKALQKDLAHCGLDLIVHHDEGKHDHLRLFILDRAGGFGMCLVINGSRGITAAVERRINAAVAARKHRGRISSQNVLAVRSALTEARRWERKRAEDLLDMARREFCSERVRTALLD